MFVQYVVLEVCDMEWLVDTAPAVHIVNLLE